MELVVSPPELYLNRWKPGFAFRLNYSTQSKPVRWTLRQTVQRRPEPSRSPCQSAQPTAGALALAGSLAWLAMEQKASLAMGPTQKYLRKSSGFYAMPCKASRQE
jgi:hypothetical protein